MDVNSSEGRYREDILRIERETKKSRVWVEKRLRSKRRRSRLTALALILFLAAVYLGTAYWRDFFPFADYRETSLIAVEFEVNGAPVKVAAGELLRVKTSDSLKLVNIDTTAVFDWSLDFESDVFSRDILLNGGRVDEAMGDTSWMLDGTRPIRVTYKGNRIGRVDLAVVADETYWWLRAERVSEPKDKIIMIEKVLELDPSSESAHESLAELYEKTGEWLKAAEHYEWLAQRDPKPLFISKLIDLFRKNGSSKQQAAGYERIAALDPSVENLILAARTLEENAQMSRAVPYYEKALSLLPDPERAAVRKKLGYYFVQTGDLASAVTQYEAAAQLDSTDPNVFYNLGTLYQRTKQPRKAIGALEKADALRPGDRDTVALLVEQYAAVGEYSKLVPYVTDLLKSEPENTSYRLMLVRAYRELDDKDALIDQYEALCRLSPDNSEVFFDLGVLYFDRRDYNKSERNLKRAAELNPGHPEVHRYLYVIYKRTGKRNQAIKEAERHLEIDATERSLYDYLFRELKDRDPEALKVVLQEGVKALPDDGKLREYLGFVYLKEQNVPYAIAQFEQARQLSPNDISLLYQLAKLYETSGQPETALKYYERVIKIDNEYRDAEASFLRLRYSRMKGK